MGMTRMSAAPQGEPQGRVDPFPPPSTPPSSPRGRARACGACVCVCVCACARLADGRGSLDFVYVDAMHTYPGSRGDLVTWWPKVTAI